VLVAESKDFVSVTKRQRMVQFAFGRHYRPEAVGSSAFFGLAA